MRVFVNLSKFFTDHRSLSVLLIDNNLHNIGDVENKISRIFDIKNFYLKCDNGYLPPLESVELLSNDETIWAVPFAEINQTHREETAKKSKKKKHKERSHKNRDQGESEKNGNDEHRIKRKKKKHIYNNDFNEIGKDAVVIEKQRKKINEEFAEFAWSVGDKKIDVTLPTTNELEENEHSGEKIEFESLNVVKRDSNNKHTLTDEVVKSKRKKKTHYDDFEKEKSDEFKEVGHYGKESIDSKLSWNSHHVTVIKRIDPEKLLVKFLHKPVNAVKIVNVSTTRNSDPPDTLGQITSPSNCISEDGSVRQINELNKEEPVEGSENGNSLVKALPEVMNISHTKDLNPSDVIAQSTPVHDSVTQINEINKEEPVERNENSYLINTLLETIKNSNTKDPNSSDLIAQSNPLCDSVKEISELNLLVDSAEMENSDCTSSTVSSKRKRRRIRKRKSKFKELALENSFNTSLQTVPIVPPPLLHIPSRNQTHIRFNDGNDDTIEQVEKENSKTPVSDHPTQAPESSLFLTDESILKHPPLCGDNLKAGDIIAFKALRIAENYTPQLSSYIIGKVTEYDQGNVVFDVTYGRDQLIQPRGKFSIEDDATEKANETCKYTFPLSDLYYTRILSS